MEKCIRKKDKKLIKNIKRPYRTAFGINLSPPPHPRSNREEKNRLVVRVRERRTSKTVHPVPYLCGVRARYASAL